MTTSILLEARDLEVGYLFQGVRKTVSRGIRCELRAGRLVCLLGPNGAGKSTLLRTLAGLQPHLAGSLRLAGTEAGDLTAPERARRLALVLTDRSETTHLGVRELVALGRAPHTGWLGRLSGADAAGVQRALEVTGSLDHAARRLGELSDGERQKVLIARALAQDTPVLLLDEPTAYLDLPNRIAVMQLLQSLAEAAGKAVLLSTHELDLALQAADEIWLMEPGGNLHCGAPEDLILDGTLASAFRREGFEFDPATGFVRFQRPARGWVALHGEGPRAQWTRRALERKGFRVAGFAGNIPPAGVRVRMRVRVLPAESEPALWRLEAGESQEDFPTLEALVDALTVAANRLAKVEA